MKTVFITGVAGFLGSHIAREFLRLGWRVAGIDHLSRESTRLPDDVDYVQMKLPAPELANIIQKTLPDVCVHCAGRASVPLSMTDPASDFRDNTVLTFEILDALRVNAPLCKFLLLSSAAVYGDPKVLPITENQHVAPLSPYGFHKRQCELLCQEFARVYSLPTLAVRIFSAYGPGLRRQVVWDICEQLLTSGALILKGTGRESRDFIHASDIAHAIALLVDKAPAQGEIYNLASGRETTIAELATLAATSLGLSAKAAFDGTLRAGDPLNWRADVARITELGFKPTVSLERGLEQIATWCRAELGT